MKKEILIKKLEEFINEEERLVGHDDRHTERFRDGVKSACIVIRSELNRLAKEE